jgi:chorismate mutase/GNAT superfamily N-acetyltransferase
VSSTEPVDLQVRPAEIGDAVAIADVWTRSRRAASPAMPPPTRPAEQAAAHLATLLPDADAWVALVRDEVAGFALCRGEWLDMLYVAPERAAEGVGSALLESVKHHRPEGFGLWVFESNGPARRFYRRRGLVELERTDGSGNEEGRPDVRVVWPGRDPMSFLRRQVDEVDAELADVINRRLALTREIQRHKEVPGHAGRDEAREAEIARRMAERVPALSVEQWRRLVHEVITVSLDVAGGDDRRP